MNAARKRELVHETHVITAPTGYLVRCSCGWARMIPRQNALARAAKVKAAIAAHEREVKDRTR